MAPISRPLSARIAECHSNPGKVKDQKTQAFEERMHNLLTKLQEATNFFTKSSNAQMQSPDRKRAVGEILEEEARELHQSLETAEEVYANLLRSKNQGECSDCDSESESGEPGQGSSRFLELLQTARFSHSYSELPEDPNNLPPPPKENEDLSTVGESDYY